MSNRVVIRVASNPHDLEAVYRLRYEIYVEEMRRKQRYADHTRRLIEDPLDIGSINLMALCDSRIVGTVRVNFPHSSSIGEYERFYGMASVGADHPRYTSINTRLMVSREFRQTSTGLSLAIASYRYGAPLGVKWNFIDCNDNLMSFFTGLGYVAHLPKAEHPEYGLVNRLRLNVTDLAHLEAVHSPFAPILRTMRGLATHEPAAEFV